KGYQALAELIRTKKIDRVVGVGPQLSRFRKLFAENSVFYPDTRSLIRDLPALAFQNESILLKGARAFRFEEVSSKLLQRVHGTVLEINLNAMQHNLNQYRNMLG